MRRQGTFLHFENSLLDQFGVENMIHFKQETDSFLVSNYFVDNFLCETKKSMNKTSVLELIFYAVLQRSEKQQLIRKFATQTLDKNFDTISGEVFIISSY